MGLCLPNRFNSRATGRIWIKLLCEGCVILSYLETVLWAVLIKLRLCEVRQNLGSVIRSLKWELSNKTYLKPLMYIANNAWGYYVQLNKWNNARNATVLFLSCKANTSTDIRVAYNLRGTLQVKRSHHISVQIPESHSARNLLTKNKLPDGIISHQY